MDKKTAKVGSDIGKVVHDDGAPIVKLESDFLKRNKLDLLLFVRENKCKCLLQWGHIVFLDDKTFCDFKLRFEGRDSLCDMS